MTRGNSGKGFMKAMWRRFREESLFREFFKCVVTGLSDLRLDHS